MRSVLTGIVQHLRNTPEFMDSLEGGNIYDVQQPSDDASLPVVTTLWQDAPVQGSKGVRFGLITFDIWDDEGSTVRIENIRDELEAALDRRILTIDNKFWVRVFVGNDSQVPTEVGETLVHWTIDFSAKYFRQSFWERRLSE